MEEWKKITTEKLQSITNTQLEFVDDFSVSNYGNIKNNKTNNIYKFYTTKEGYEIVSLPIIRVRTGTKSRKMFQVHRVVAAIWISNPQNLPYVNHKDENKSNNYVSNLEWCTSKYNSTYGMVFDKKYQTICNKNKKLMKRIIQLSIDGAYINTFPTLTDAEKETGVYMSNIKESCMKVRKSTKGFIFMYEKEYLENKNLSGNIPLNYIQNNRRKLQLS